MSTGELLSKTIHNATPIESLDIFRQELLKTHSMTSPVVSSFLLEDEMAQLQEGNRSDSSLESAETLRAASRLTPIDLVDLSENPRNYNIAFLRKLLKERDLSSTGKKAALVERLALYG